MIYIIIFSSILLPIVLQEKKIALIVSFSLIFILWGLQYDMVQDWSVNLSRWNSVNHKGDIFREVEPLLAFLMSLAKPITFFGWLIVCAIFELITLYYFTRKYVPPKYYWITIFILMLRIDYGLLLINSNRQTLSVILSMYAVLILLQTNKLHYLKYKKIPILKILVAGSILYAATQIHSAAFLSYIIIPIYLFVILIPRPNIKMLLIVFNILFIGRYFFDVSSHTHLFQEILNSAAVEGFDGYLNALDTSTKTYSMIDQPIYLFLINSAIYFYPKMNTSMRFFSLSFTIGTIIGGYMVGNLYRSTQYLYIYLVFLAPALVFYWNHMRNINFNKIKMPLYCIMILYCIYSFQKNLQDGYYKKWNDFTTIFEAPKWL